jgi:lipopolysaccharide export LptBFGC system permease protein LptF
MQQVEDAKQRLEIVKDNLNVFRDQSVLFQQKSRSTDELQKTKREAEEKIGFYETKEQEAETAAETYDREFLDRKEKQPDPFVYDKFFTVQDKTLLFFWISYVILVLFMIVGSYLKTNDIKQVAYYLLFAILLGVFLFGIILKYA